MKTFSRILLRPIIFFLCFEIFLHAGSTTFLISQTLINKISTFSQSKDKKEYTILCMGDSFTAYGGMNSYPKILERILNNNSSYHHFTVINKGIPARPSNDLVSFLNINLEKYNPDIVTIMMGIQDYSLKRRINSSTKERIKLWLLQNIKTFRLAKRLIDPLRPDLKKRLETDDVGLWRDNQQLDIDTNKNKQIIFPQEEKFNKNNGDQLKIDEDATKKLDALINIHPITINSFQDFVEIVTRKNKKLIIIQYPLMDINPLKYEIKSNDSVFFVENKNNFKNALEISNRKDYFDDLQTPLFGHCTPLGNTLISKQLSSLILSIIDSP